MKSSAKLRWTLQHHKDERGNGLTLAIHIRVEKIRIAQGAKKQRNLFCLIKIC
jgi:hypothetical protein